ncbi:MAG: tetratricopeptide repeat protein, partial [Spirochaetota bacterium]
AKNLYDEESATYYLLGLVEARQENYTEAIEYINQALQLKPDSAQYQFDLALCHMENEDYENAQNLFDKVMETYYQDQSLLVYVCDLCDRTGNYKKGINIIESIPKDELGEPYLVYQLAQFYNKLGNNKEKVLNLLNEARDKARYLKDKNLIEEIGAYENEIN